MINFILIVACADEVKGIEFTVTTLNCTQDQNNVAPLEHRRKFSSLRKTGALSKAVRSKISKSFYSNSSGNKSEKSTSNAQATTTSTASPAATNASVRSNDVQHSGKDKSTIKAESAMNLATAASTNKTDKPEKHKKRSKLCQLL